MKLSDIDPLSQDGVAAAAGALSRAEHATAIRLYARLIAGAPEREALFGFNLALARRRYRAARREEPLRVGICGWRLSDNSAGRAQVLADLYGDNVEMFGALYKEWGGEIWPPLRKTPHPYHLLRLEKRARFPAQAFDFVLEHPYDLLHISKPRMPNLIFGLLYKLLWGARVIVDVDDEDLGGIGAETAAGLEALPRHPSGKVKFEMLGGKEATRVGIGLWDIFDAVTVSNPALQKRYGGIILPHARSAEHFTPSPERKRASRERFGIPQDKTVVLFFGTARRHKGLIETAEALRQLGRSDICFVIAGDIADAELRADLQALDGVEVRILPAQPYEDIADVVALGDICILLQNPGSLLAQYQFPAKLVDALAMGLLVFAQRTLALEHLIDRGAVIPVTPQTLAVELAHYLQDPDKASSVRNAGRKLFLEDFEVGAGRRIVEENISRNSEVLELPDVLPSLLETQQREVFEALGGWRSFYSEGGAQAPALALPDKSSAPTSEKRPTAPSNDGRQKAPAYAAVLSQEVRGTLYYRKLVEVLGDKPPQDLVEKIRFAEGRLEKAAAKARAASEKSLVSIIMPTYNRATIISDAVSSVLEQSYDQWELLVCDDGSEDETEEVIAKFGDERIRYLKLPKRGAAAARNAGLGRAQGEIIAYLDSDNLWHPHYLARMVEALCDHPGKSACYGNFIDYRISGTGKISLRAYERPSFVHERLLDKNFIDLNTFVHRRELYDIFGGFNEALTRRQDYDLIVKYTWLRDPVKVNEIMALYQRNDSLSQITATMKHDGSCIPIIDGSIKRYLESGLPVERAPNVTRVTVISWDLCRNHFSKAYAVAEALSAAYEVKLVSFRFFEEEIFPPLQGVTPPFKTAYFSGAQFPEFFASMKRGLEEIDGDIVYVVKPRLPSLGLALLANAVKGTPIVLEINDLETVVAAPKAGDQHREITFEDIKLSDPELLNPYSNLWSQLMDPLAKSVPTLVTHNKNLDAHYGNRCLYMRNLKDERVYDPALYDRAAVRHELGFTPEDRVILFGGLLRKHKGIYELIELVDRLEDPAYKLLFVGSRVTPDQNKLVERFGEQIRVLPPQDRESMARINLAADLVILWLDPDVPASHYQMPYKATDAFAMGPHIIANDISDLGPLHRQGYVTRVAFGDWKRMTKAIRDVFERPERTERMRHAGRRLFLRQFSYAAARSCFALAAERAVQQSAQPLSIATAFAARFEEFFKACGQTGSFLKGTAVCPPAKQETPIKILDAARLGEFRLKDPGGVAVVMPSIDVKKARDTAQILLKRAGMAVTILIAEDTARQGFIRTLNDVAARLDVKYIVYLAEDAFPGLGWLKVAYGRLEETNKGLLAFNCGKWRGRIAAFGMVRMGWVRTLYGGPVLFSGYQAHKADNEITLLARVTGQAVYEPDAVLVEIDPGKQFKENVPEDKELFHSRFKSGFDGLVPFEQLKPYAQEYFVPLSEKVQVTERRHRCTGRLQHEFLLYRIIGNDLSPRHDAGQSLRNLEFILEHEPELAACERRFIINRVSDAEVENAIIRKLERSGHRYLRVPFDPNEYRNIGFEVDVFGEPGFLASAKYQEFPQVKKDRVQATVYRHKNNYVMHNNGARNLALADAKAKARWVLPWDGNCFLTQEAWEAIREDIRAADHQKYFVVPMARMPSNRTLLEGGPFPEPVEEPQIIFRHDAELRFDERFSYGRRPKVELLWRLGVAGKWDTYKDDPWDPPRSPVTNEADNVGKAGWVARLSSGRADLEAHNENSTLNRGFARTEAILSTLRTLDAQLAGAEPSRTTSVCLEKLDNLSRSGTQGDLLRARMVADAEAALTRGPYSVCDKTTLPPSGELRDYWHPAPYWWPNPAKPDGLPYIRKDGERVPGTRMYEPESDKYDRTRLQRVFDDSFVLALAWRITQEQKYADHAVAILKRFFVDPDTAMNPHLRYGQVRMGHNGNQGAPTGLIEMKDMYFYLDAVRILVADGAVDAATLTSFRRWLSAYLEWLITSPQGKAECIAINNHGTCYDLQVGAIAAFLGETGLIYETLARAQSRIAKQLDAEGRQPDELKRKTTAHYCCFNFQSWINLSNLAKRWGVDLWDYKGPEGASLKQAARWLLAHMGQPWPYEQIDDFDSNRFLPIWFAARGYLDEPPELPSNITSAADAPPVFFPHDGIRPYWNLDY